MFSGKTDLNFSAFVGFKHLRGLRGVCGHSCAFVVALSRLNFYLFAGLLTLFTCGSDDFFQKRWPFSPRIVK